MTADDIAPPTGTRQPTASTRTLPQGPVPDAAMLQAGDVARGQTGGLRQ